MGSLPSVAPRKSEVYRDKLLTSVGGEKTLWLAVISNLGNGVNLPTVGGCAPAGLELIGPESLGFE